MKSLRNIKIWLTTVTITPTVPILRDRSSAHAIQGTLEMESRVKVSKKQLSAFLWKSRPWWSVMFKILLAIFLFLRHQWVLQPPGAYPCLPKLLASQGRGRATSHRRDPLLLWTEGMDWSPLTMPTCSRLCVCRQQNQGKQKTRHSICIQILQKPVGAQTAHNFNLSRCKARRKKSRRWSAASHCNAIFALN